MLSECSVRLLTAAVIYFMIGSQLYVRGAKKKKKKNE